MFATEAVREASGKIIGEGFGNSEDDDESQDGYLGCQVELLHGYGRQDAALHADHCPYKSIDDDQQRKLAEIFTQSEANRNRIQALAPQAMYE